jgi:hypothetical protein
MSNFEILTINRLNTTTAISVNSGTSTVGYLFDRQRSTQYASSGYNTSTAGMTMGCTFLSTQTVSRIVLQNINLKNFTIYHSSNPANVITLLNAATTTSNWQTNSETSLYLKFATIQASSIFIVASSTMIASEEKKIGELGIYDLKFVFVDNPADADFTPKRAAKEVTHEMSDGGTTKYTFGDAFECKIKLKYQGDTMVGYLRDLFEDRETFTFTPFPTSTSWDGYKIYEVNWIGDFDFDNPAGNNWRSLGWDGTMQFKETPK